MYFCTTNHNAKRMRKLLFTLFVIIPDFCIASHNVNLDSLYTVLDAAIDSADIYLKQKTDRIAALKSNFLRANTNMEKYECATSLCQEYTPFDNDSAIAYHYLCMEIGRAHV